MVAIVLVRHASTDWSGSRYCGTSDPPLSGAGEEQARELARALVAVSSACSRLVSSPLLRAVSTAEAIGREIGASIEIDRRWREADCGVAEGRTFDELSAIAPDVAAALGAGTVDIDWPDGETAASLRERVRAALRDLVEDGRPVVVVTHAGPFMHARAIAEGRGPGVEDLVGPATAVELEIAADWPSPTPVLPSRA